MSNLRSLRLPDPVWRTPLVQWRLSAERARLTGALDDQCWSNALGAAALASERLGEPVWRVEGVAVARTGALALVHGWLEAEDGLVLDPTPAWCARPAVRGRRYLRLATVEPAELHAARKAVGPSDQVLHFPLSYGDERFAELHAREQAAMVASWRAAPPEQLWRGALAASGRRRASSIPCLRETGATMTDLPSLRMFVPVRRSPLVQRQLLAELAVRISAPDDAERANALHAAAATGAVLQPAFRSTPTSTHDSVSPTHIR